MFLGSVPQDMRNIVAEHARSWRGDAWVGCSGNMTLERVLTSLNTGLALHSNDVTGYTSALGWYFSGQPVDFTLKEESRELLGWLEPYLETDVDRLATIMLGTRFLAHVEDPNRFYARVLAGTKSQFPRMHAKTVEKLKASPLKLASYHPMDVREWVRDVVPPEDPVAMFPPFYGGERAIDGKIKGDYEKMFEGIDRHFDWPAPTYPALDEAGKDELLDLVVDRPEWVLGLHVRRDELQEYLRGMVQTANRGLTIYLYARTAHLRIVRPRQAVEPILMPKIGHDDDLGDRMTLHVLNYGQFAMIRSQFMSKTIKPGSPALAVGVAVDGKIIGAFAFDDFDPNMGDSTTTAYLLSDFPVSWSKYRRLAKLIVIAALSDEARQLFQRDLARPITHLATTAFSDRPMSAKYGRGIPGMKLLNRGKGKDGIHAFTLNYGAPMGQWTLQEGLALWKKKHGSDVRSREEIPV